MAKPESWLKRNIVAIAAATIAAIGVVVIWHNGNKPAPAAPMTATASAGATAVNATSGAVVQIGPAASTPASTPPAAASTAAPGPMHASAGTGGTAVNAAGSAQVTVPKAATENKP